MLHPDITHFSYSELSIKRWFRPMNGRNHLFSVRSLISDRLYSSLLSGLFYILSIDSD